MKQHVIATNIAIVLVLLLTAFAVMVLFSTWNGPDVATAAQQQFSSRERETSATLRVLTLNFNSEAVLADEQGLLRRLRFDALVQWIQKHNVDVVFLCEAWNDVEHGDSPSVVATLARALDYDYAFSLEIGFPGVLQVGNGFICKRELNLSSCNNFKLAGSFPTLGPRAYWVTMLGPVSTLMCGCIDWPSSTQRTAVFGTHVLEPMRSSPGMVQDLSRLIDRYTGSLLLEQGGSSSASSAVVAQLLMGDLNSEPDSAVLSDLLRRGWIDAWTRRHLPDSAGDGDPHGFTQAADIDSPYFNPFTVVGSQTPAQDTLERNMRIDYILFRKHTRPQPLTLGEKAALESSLSLDVIDSRVVFDEPIDSPTNGASVWMSDHFGVTCEFGYLQTTQQVQAVARKAAADANASRVITRPIPKATKLVVDDKWLLDISLPLPLLYAHERGVVVVNQLTSGSIGIAMRGVGSQRFFPTSAVALAPGRVAAFVMMDSGQYVLSVRVNGKVRCVQIQL